MQAPIIVANLKSNLTKTEANYWLEDFKRGYKNPKGIKIIVCPPFTALSIFYSFLNENKLDIFLGAQNISPFTKGPYTGEINGEQIKDFADYILIGHSERRSNFMEDESQLLKKIAQSLSSGLTPFYFIQTKDQTIPKNIEYVVYEPPGSISNVSNGKPDDLDNVVSAAKIIHQKGDFSVLYGGSVNSGNIKDFLGQSDIEGVVVGNASVNAKEFLNVIENA